MATTTRSTIRWYTPTTTSSSVPTTAQTTTRPQQQKESPAPSEDYSTGLHAPTSSSGSSSSCGCPSSSSSASSLGVEDDDDDEKKEKDDNDNKGSHDGVRPVTSQIPDAAAAPPTTKAPINSKLLRWFQGRFWAAAPPPPPESAAKEDDENDGSSEEQDEPVGPAAGEGEGDDENGSDAVKKREEESWFKTLFPGSIDQALGGGGVGRRPRDRILSHLKHAGIKGTRDGPNGRMVGLSGFGLSLRTGYQHSEYLFFDTL